MADIDQAVDNGAAAVDATPPDHYYRGRVLSHFGNCLSMRFKESQSVVDLDRATLALKEALATMPEGHPDRLSVLTNYGVNLVCQFERTQSTSDLNHAIGIMELVLVETPPDHPSRAKFLINFVNLLVRRLTRTGSPEDLHRILTLCRENWNSETAVPSYRVRLAKIAAGVLLSGENWQEASQLLHDVVHLAPAVCPRSLKHTDKQHLLQEFVGMASLAAAVALNANKDVCHALQLLELGRGVIAGSLIDMRGDISELGLMYPDLADEFVSLRHELDSGPADETFSPQKALATDGVSSWESRLRRRREADQRFNGLIAKIRAQPGFDRFLLPPTEEQLMAAASPSPIVVINLSLYRSDGFLVERNRIRVIELPELQLQEVKERFAQLQRCRLMGSSDDLASILEWLWDVVCRPCLEALGLRDPVSETNVDWPHVVWIPTGILSQLPLHAAERYSKGPSTDTVLDRTMSSYASSIKALMYARRNFGANAQTDTALLVGMGQTPNLATNGVLPSVDREIDMVKGLCPSLGLKAVAPPQRKQDVIQHLRACKLFHFAGHGQSDPTEPSRSCLLLQDWKTGPLTAGDLRDSRLHEHPPFLAYLSACSTGSSTAAKLVDEGVHLVSAFQLAGLRHVVGTLWEVSDGHCAKVASVLYQTLQEQGMTDAAVSRGLHRAIRGIRDRWRTPGNARAGDGVPGDDLDKEWIIDEDWESDSRQEGMPETNEDGREEQDRDVLKVSKKRNRRPETFSGFLIFISAHRQRMSQGLLG